MAALPYIQLYVADYLADTAHLTTIEHGAYLLLIFNYWQKGESFKAKDEQTLNKRLATVARMNEQEWEIVKETLSEFFEISENEWTHSRIERDLLIVNSKSINAKAAGKASAQKRAHSKGIDNKKDSSERSTNVQRTFNHTEADTDTDTDNTTILSRDPVDNFLVDNEQESEDCGIYANMSNAGNIDSTINSDTSAETRSNAMFWVEYFVNQHGFSFAESQTAKTVPMFIDWVKRGVDVDDVEVAIIAATGSLNGRRPSNPTYYRNFVNSVLDQKLNQGGKNGKNNQSGRKLSLCDKAAAIVQRSIEIERLRTEKKIN